MPYEIQYEMEDLRRFIEKDPDAIVAFYGGEPLLRIKLMLRMMDSLPAKRFVVQTNGLFLDNIPLSYLNRLDAILVSIDGREKITDYYRGHGVYRMVVNNVRKIRPYYKGDLIARMTVSEESDIYEEVKHLLSLPFDHVHWQLNVVWSPEDSWHDFDSWVHHSYNPGITRLSELWMNNLKRGKILGIVPFLGIIKRMLFGGEGLPCGAGRDAFSITTDGRILACPIGGEFEWNELGDIWSSEPKELRNSVDVEEPCKSCDIYHICGGRCLFANKERLWGENGFRKICGTVRHIVNEMRRAKSLVEELINRGIFNREDFFYPSFNNTTEIIP